MHNFGFGKKVMVGVMTLGLAATTFAAPMSALAANRPDNTVPDTVPIDTNRNKTSDFSLDTYKPTAALGVGGYVNGAATRAAGPAAEIVGMASLEESGQFVNTSNYYDWQMPKYWLSASYYNCEASPYLANLATGLSAEADTKAELVARTGAGPNASLLAGNPVWQLGPDVVIGTGEGDDWYGTDGRHATGVPYVFKNFDGLSNTMHLIANAADGKVNNPEYDDEGVLIGDDEETRNLRFGSASQIANLYERYIYGTTGRVLQALDQNRVEKKTVALVQSATYSERDGQWLFDLMTTEEATDQTDGTASQNRYMETVLSTGLTDAQGNPVTLADNYAQQVLPASAVRSSDVLAHADLILVGGQQGSATYANIMTALGSISGALDKTYFVQDNGSAGAMYGVVMNSVENAQNMGRILGMLYPTYSDGSTLVSQRAWLAYYYTQFYHVDPSSAMLKLCMSNALDGVRNAAVTSPADATAAVQWTIDNSGYPSGFGASETYAAINDGWTYYQNYGTSNAE